ncbi:MAG: IS66 family transposase, partial [Planctomycetota bacterium]
LSLEELKRLVLELFEENAKLRSETQGLREEIARLKGLKGRPQVKPSGMDKRAKARRKAKQGRKQAKRNRGAKRLAVDEDRVIATPHPEGSRFKGYEDYVVQELVMKRLVVRYRRERWMTPAGLTIVAPLPAGLRGHFGSELRRFVLAVYHQGQTTVERLLALLCGLGVEISKRQLVRLLSEGQEAFVAEAEAVLESGLESAQWVSVDDTGARHQARNGYTTQIGNDHFTWFGTSFSKSRLNFLELLRAGHRDYVINQEALTYMKGRNLSAGAIARLEASKNRHFTSQSAFLAHLQALGLTRLTVQPDPVRIAQEGALWGAIAHHGLLRDSVILSDDAGQFKLARHALCWIHAERLIHKLEAFSDRQHQAKERIRRRIWWLYADLKAYRQRPSRRRRGELSRRFDQIFTSRTGFATLDRLLARLHANKAELLCVLERPEVPLHTNQSENDIRCQVTRRKISGGTKSQAGKEAKDAFLGLMKTCQKLGISFWDYLGDRLQVPDACPIKDLAEIVRLRHTATA